MSCNLVQTLQQVVLLPQSLLSVETQLRVAVEVFSAEEVCLHHLWVVFPAAGVYPTQLRSVSAAEAC